MCSFPPHLYPEMCTTHTQMGDTVTWFVTYNKPQIHLLPLYQDHAVIINPDQIFMQTFLKTSSLHIMPLEHLKGASSHRTEEMRMPFRGNNECIIIEVAVCKHKVGFRLNWQFPPIPLPFLRLHYPPGAAF